MAGLVGEFEVKLDAKGRFMFPSALRKQLQPTCQRDFMLNKGFEDCLTLFPLTEWEKVSQRLSRMNLFKPKNRMFVFDGDGNILMNLGSLATIGKIGPNNLIHLVFEVVYQFHHLQLF